MNIRKIHILFFLCIAIIYSALFYALGSKSFYLYYKNLDQKYSFLPSLALIDRGMNEINISKALIKRGGAQDIDSINLSLSYQDLTAYRDYYFNSLNNEKNYLPDKGNDWRKAKINLPNNDELKIKIKLHGTSSIPIKNSKGFISSKIYSLKKGYFDISEYPKKYIDITNGGYAFKVKLRDNNVYDGISRLNLLSPHDDWTVTGNALNKYMSSMGIITTYGNFYNLFVNGSGIGLYLGVENIDKSLLERNFQITNYAILKNIDDWNKAWGPGHSSPTMFTSGDMEQKGDPFTQKIALYQIDRLFNAIENSDYETIKSIIDIEYFAKLYAALILVGDFHPLTGDNTKYIYDFSTGTFKIALRLEGAPSKVKILNKKKSTQLKIHYGPHILFNSLSTQKWFVDATYKYLEDIYRDMDKIITLINEEHKIYRTVAAKSRFPSNHHSYKYFNDIETINSNLQLIENLVKKKHYFSLNTEMLESKKDFVPGYTKVFLTVEKNLNNEYILKVLNDSISHLSLLSLEKCDGSNFNFEEKLNIEPSEYDNNSGLIKNIIDHKHKIPFMCLSDAYIINNETQKKIDPRHIYINYSQSFEIIKENGLDQLGASLRKIVDTKNSSLIYSLVKGHYLIKEDLILPKGAKLILEPGVNISLSDGISILVRGPLYAKGTEIDPIVIKNLNATPFGTFAVKGSTLNPSKVIIENFYLEGGSESIIDGTYFSGQFSVHIGDVIINKSVFSNSFSDDGINIKKGKVEIINSVFKNNSADQIDLDFVSGYVSNNVFTYSIENDDVSTDGLDVSGSKLNIMNNKFTNMTDKGLSIGEKSKVNIYNNSVKNNNIGIALKDGSEACLSGNSLINNTSDLSRYIKKNMYSEPVLYVDNQFFNKKINGLENCNIQNFTQNVKEFLL